MTDQVALRQIHRALRAGDKLSDEQVVKLAQLRRATNASTHHVAVSKFELREGEELWTFVDAIWMAVQTNRVVLADGSLDAWLVGVYNDHVVVQDGNTGRLFMSKFTRNDMGEFVFEAPIEVRQIFVPVDSQPEDAAKSISKRANAPVEFVDVARARDDGKFGFLPSTLRRRR
jgi:hypothetical protein